jgi:sulfur carrier protein
MDALPEILVNGEPRPLRASHVADLLAELGLGGRREGIAVAVNGEVVPRSCWQERSLAPGDEVEIVTAVQGG